MQETGIQRKTFLFVDDDPNYLASVTALFREMSNGRWAIRTATNHAQAREQLKAQSVHAIVLDVEMPVMDGKEASRAIRELERDTGRHVAIVALSAHPSTENRAECLAAGMDAVLVKPLRTDELDAILRQLPRSPTVQKPT